MDPRMYSLATYLRDLRQDWPLHNIQCALSEVDALPYGHVAIGAVRAALDTATTHPRGIRRHVEDEVRGRITPLPPPLCSVCRRVHDPTRPGEHVRPPVPEVARLGAAAARASMAAARATAAPAEEQPCTTT